MIKGDDIVAFKSDGNPIVAGKLTKVTSLIYEITDKYKRELEFPRHGPFFFVKIVQPTEAEMAAMRAEQMLEDEDKALAALEQQKQEALKAEAGLVE